MPAAWIAAAGLTHTNGRCDHLTPDNLCAIYSTRPKICRVEECVDLLGMPKREAFELTARQCNVWMDEDGADPSLRINLAALAAGGPVDAEPRREPEPIQ